MHPLVASTLLERHPARVDALLAPAAAAYERAAEYQRAAEIHLGRGDQEAAADALEHIEVIDEGSGTPDPLPPSDTRNHGRGLHLIDALTEAWGFEPIASGGKLVWAELVPNTAQ